MAEQEAPKHAEAPKHEFRHLVRIANTDLAGEKHLIVALTKIKGVSASFANAICIVSGFKKNTQTGSLTEAQAKKIEDTIREPSKYGIPAWMLNRRKDYETGQDMHLLGVDFDVIVDSDIKRQKKAKTYKGLRHQWGLPVRGQRTKSNFRKNKGKGLGVKKSKVGKKS
ncbi:MAG: 30S ribosomal protein S13 [Candidatus Woesearchaeota archaeon]